MGGTGVLFANLKGSKHLCRHCLESVFVLEHLFQRHEHSCRLNGAIHFGDGVALKLFPAKSQPGARNLEQLVHMGEHGFSGPGDDWADGVVFQGALCRQRLDSVLNACNDSSSGLCVVHRYSLSSEVVHDRRAVHLHKQRGRLCLRCE